MAKTMLKNKYGEQIILLNFKKKNSVVCFRGSAEFLMNDKWYQSRKENVAEAALLIQIFLRQKIADVNSDILSSRQQI